MKKKVLICALLSVAAVTASAAFAGCGLFGGGGNNDDGKTVRQDNMCFVLKDDGTYELDRYEYADLREGYDEDGNTIPAYSGEGETVIVPDEVNGKAVTSIDSWAFGNTGVKEVTLPDTISVLSDRIFDGCTLLKTVNFPTVTAVGELAFKDCGSLESIAFESGLTEIGKRAFEYCTSLAEITLPDTVKTIGDDCFRKCPFDSINAAGVEVLGKYAFDECANLTELNLPNVVSIGERAFYYCDSLTEMTIGNKLESCEDGLNFLTKVSIDSPIPNKLFMWAENLSDVTLGEGVTSIGEMAFGYTFALKNITLPATLTGISESAFNQSGLTSVTIPAAVQTIGDSAFYSCRGLTSLTVENGVGTIGKSAFEEAGITSLSLPASVKAIGKSAFDGCNSLAEITFSEGLETIGDLAFAIKGAETLDIVLPSTVKAIGGGCFNYSWGSDKGITANKIVINDTVETVGKDILKNCKVKELTAPANYGHNATSVETLTLFGEGEIPYEAYYYNTALKTVDLGGGVKKIGSRAFRALESITLDGVEYMGDNALGNLSALTYTKSENGVNYIDNWVISTDYSNGGATQLDLSGYYGIYHNAFKKTDTNDTSVLNTVVLVSSDGTSQLKFIGDRAFSGSGVTAVEVPASLETWNGAFNGCKSLQHISIQHGVEKIAENAFADCNALDGLNFAATDVKEIGRSAFSGCTGLRLITLPNGIKKIDEYAFAACTTLMLVNLNGAEEIENYAFSYCASLGEVTMNSVKTIGDCAFYQCTVLTEYDLPASVTAIGRYALGSAQTVNYNGTPTQWAAIKKGNSNGRDIWYTDNDLTVSFSDGGSATLHKSES
ncbi:MAG: leucine-rich repeat domain-containing protein [Clostridia bacterium]|nr:leucine-rich repeat domain-containing protein [Clostridia bacterium]